MPEGRLARTRRAYITDNDPGDENDKLEIIPLLSEREMQSAVIPQADGDSGTRWTWIEAGYREENGRLVWFTQEHIRRQK